MFIIDFLLACTNGEYAYLFIAQLNGNYSYVIRFLANRPIALISIGVIAFE